MKRKTLQCLLTVVLFSCISSLSAQPTKDEVLARIYVLENLIIQAEGIGIEVFAERMTVELGKQFLTFASWDSANIQPNLVRFQARLPFPKEFPTPPSPEELAQSLPDFERAETLYVVDKAIERLEKLIAGDISRPPMPAIDWTQLSIVDNDILYAGRPVFLHNFNFIPEDDSIRKYFGQDGGIYVAPNQFIKNALDEVVMKNGARNGILNNTRNIWGGVFINQNQLPEFITTEHPDIVNGGSLYTGFDIDHPAAKTLHQDMFRLLVPMATGKSFSKTGYLLTNEPHWFTAEGSYDLVEITPYTKKKFENWLNTQHGSIDSLNTLWGSSYLNFQEAVDAFPFPIPTSWQGTPQWYDWMRFNQMRVTAWFQFMKDEIRSHDPNAKTHVKLIPRMWADVQHDHGLDYEAITAMSDIIGHDAQSADSYLFGARPDWMDYYDIHWENSAMAQDFFHSIQPHAINYNSEGHFISSVRFRDLELKEPYVRTTHWLFTLMGMDYMTNWVWGRDTDGSILSKVGNASYPGSYLQMPRVLSELMETVYDLNRVSEEIAALQDWERPIRIFYSETSALNKESYMRRLRAFYRSLFFEGLGVGFVTENILNTHDPSNWEIVVVPESEYVTDEEFAAIQNYLENGGTVIVEGNSLQLNEYGQNRTAVLDPGTGTLITSSLALMKSEMRNYLATQGIQPVIQVEETNSHGGEIKGCYYRAVEMADGRKIISLVNLANVPVQIELSMNSVSSLTAKNLLSEEVVDPLNIEMAPETVLLLEVSENGPNPVPFQLKARVLLQGMTNPATGLMESPRRDSNLVPLSSPFHVAPYFHLGGESVTALPNNALDWVLVEVHSPVVPFPIVTQKAVFVSSSGVLLDLDGSPGIHFPGLAQGPYLLAVYHLGHLGVLSADTLSYGLNPPQYNFAHSMSRAMGIDQQVPLGAYYGMHAGDFDGNGFINNLDFNLWKANASVLNVYFRGDADANGIINNLDFNLWKTNRSKVGIPEVQK